MMRGVLRGVIALAIVSGAAATPAAAAAVRETPETAGYLAVSGDGRSFAVVGDLDLFDAAARFVPGDVTTASFWLRNDAPDAGRVRLDLVDLVVGDDPDARAFARAVDIRVATEGRSLGGTTLAAASTGDCTMLTDGITLDSGESVRVDASVRIGPELGSLPGQDGRAGVLSVGGFRLRATMAEAAAGRADPAVCPRPGIVDGESPPAGPDPDHPSVPAGADPSLAVTGGVVHPMPIIAGVILLSAGVAAFAAGRRRSTP